MKLSQLATTLIIALTSSLFNPFHYGNFNRLGISSVLAADFYVNNPDRPINGKPLTLEQAHYLVFLPENLVQYGNTLSEADKQAIIEDMPKIEEFLEKNDGKIEWGKICTVYQIAEDWKRAVNACKKELESEQSNIEQGEFLGELGINDPFAQLAEAYIGAGEYDNAINYLNKGLEFSKVGHLSGLPKETNFKFSYLLLMRLGTIYLKLGNYQESIKYYQQALDNVSSNQQALTSQFHGIVSSIHEGIAFALLRQGNLQEAEKSFIEAKKNDEISWEQTVSFLKPPYIEGGMTEGNLVDELSFYPYGLQELKVKQGKYNEALELAEMGRTRILSYLISKSNDTSITISEIQQLARKKNATIVKYSWLESPSKSVSAKADYSSQIYIWAIQPSGEIYFSQVDLSQPSINSPQTQVESFTRGINLNSNSSINSKLLIPWGILLIGISLSYFLLRHRKPLMIVGIVASGLTSSFLFFQQNQTPSLNIDNKSLVQLTQQTFATVRSNNRDTLSNAVTATICKDQTQCLDRLSQILINPIAQFLPKNPEESVIFIPDRELFRVPFAALKTADGKYLIEKHPIQIYPSIQTLQRIDQESSNNTLNLTSNALIVGNPTMPKMENGQQLPALPGTEKEAQVISNFLGTQPLIGEQANIQNVTGQMPNADIIHLATHGNDQAIALAPADEQSGFLGQEIYRMHLRANLVVLSACDTGLGDITSDGVVGIARPFMAAGVKSVVVSLWSVPDAATSDLMIEFYNNLKTKPNKAQALQQAMLTIMKQHPEPVNWAGFILVGEAE
ncbi:MAG: CHAT domain-containing protein [Microcystis aeruginosa BS13-02]|jgi:CHAT domain-containing protein|uniref:CHAT domain-containing protein n=1 Tax=unclassified Microcystis TaxID=2643300 RepID=UPI002579C09D|nr:MULTISPECIES: CHAT domain-containing tetratricopeptide repeat protein [unclassified Microcystis]NCS23469.1 CHAT domain-containing protein [Microcystis aeruginosa BS13-02]